MAGYYISRGVVRSGVILNNDSMFVSNGGRVSATTVSSSGRLHVLAGGTASVNTVSSGGGLNVAPGGTAGATTVNSGGSMTVSSGGMVSATTVSSGGWLNGFTVETENYYSNGIHISNAIVRSGAYACLYSDQTATSATVFSGGSMTVFRGGAANATTVTSGGWLNGFAIQADTYYSNGIHISNAIVRSGAYANLYFDQTATLIMVNSKGRLTVDSGGTASVTMVSSNGSMYVSSGGTAKATTVSSGGRLYVSLGGTASATTVNFGGSMTVYSGGTASLAFNPWMGVVSSVAGATITYLERDAGVYWGNGLSGIIGKADVAEGIVISSGVSMMVYSGGAVNGIAVNSGGIMTVYSGGTANIIFDPWQRNVISSAGATITYLEHDAGVYWGNQLSGMIGKTNVAEEINISSGVSMLVFSGGSTVCTTVNSGGVLLVSRGGVAANTTVSHGGQFVVSFGTATATTVFSGGIVNGFTVQEQNFYASGLHISNAAVASGRAAELEGREQTASKVYVHAGGSVLLDGGSEISEVTVGEGGYVDVFDGTAEQILIQSGGRGEVGYYGLIRTVTVGNSGSLLVSGYSPVNSAHVASCVYGVALSGGIIAVVDGGVANSTTVSSGGSICISSGGRVSGTIVQPGGFIVVLDSGRASVAFNPWQGNIVSSSGATITYLEQDAGVYWGNGVSGIIGKADVAEGIVISNGVSMIVYSGGNADSTTVSGHGNITVGSGGSANNTLLENTACMYISSGGTASRTTAAYAKIFAYQGASMSGTELNSWGVLSAMGEVRQTTVNSSGLMHVFSGGTASGTTVNAYGSMYVSSGGSAVGILLNSNGFLDIRNADVNSLTVSRGGSCAIAGGTVNHLTLMSRGSAVVSNTEINGVEVFSSGRLDCVSYLEGKMAVSGAIVHSDGQITMSSGALISATTVSKAGTLNLENGGSSYQTHIYEEGKFTMLGVANHTVLNGGSMYIGDSAYHYYDGTGGVPTSNVYDEDIHASVNILNSSWMHVYSGGTATSNTISSNSWAHVYYGGTATSNVINSSGYLTLQDSGTADTTVLHSGGYMRLYTGAILKGETCVGGKVTVENAGTSATEDVIRAYGAKINYLVSERTTSDESIITDLGMIMGATYFVTVSDAQMSGTYRLADGAKDFTGSITVKDTANQELGVLSVGQTLQVNSVGYSLNLTGNLLTLTVSGGASDAEAPTITQIVANTTATTNQNVMVTAVFADNVALASKQYRLGSGNWLDYTGAITVTANTTIYFKAVDTAGNEATGQYTVSNIDKIAPDAPVLSVTPLNRTNGTVTVTAKFASDVVKKEYSLDGQNWQAYTKAVEVTANTTIQVRGYDEAGNVSGAEYKIANIVPLDAKGPGAVILVPKVSKYNVTVKWTKPATQDKAKITGYEVEYNGKISIVKGTSLSLKNVAVSTGNTVQVRAIDSLGRYGALSQVVSFDVADVTAPKLDKITAAINDYTGTITWSGTDNVGIVKYVVTCAGQSQTVTSGSFAKFENLTVGKYGATVQAYDAAGNASKVGKVSLMVKDATPPEKVTGLAIPSADTKYSALLSWATGVDNSGKVSGYEIKLDNGKILKSSKNSLKVSKLSVGTHTYQVRAIDKDKNIGLWSDVQTFIVKDMTAPAAVSAKAKVEENSLFLTWKTPKDNVGVAGYILKHGVNLEKTETLTASQLSFRIDGIAKGNYQYQIVAVDAAGNQSKVKSGKATIKTELPMTAMNLELPDAIPSLVFDAGASTENANSSLRYDDPLAFCSALQTENELRLTAADLFASDSEKKSPALLAAGL